MRQRQPTPVPRGCRGRAAALHTVRLLAVPALLGVLAVLTVLGLAAAPLAAQELVLERNQFAERPDRPDATLDAAAPEGAGPVRHERWHVQGAERLRVVSDDVHVAVVLRYEPLQAPGPEAPPGPEPPAGADAQPSPPPPAVSGAETPLRLLVILIVEEGARRYQYKFDGQVLGAEGLVPQRVFRVGTRGRETLLAGPPGRVREIVIQDDGDAELRLRQEAGVLELVVIPAAQGGEPSGSGRPFYLGRTLTYADGELTAAGSTTSALLELRLRERWVVRGNLFFPGTGNATVARGLVVAQIWRGDTLAVAVEGGAAYVSATDASSGATTTELRAAGGATLHWRQGRWGAAARLGLVGENALLGIAGAWQFWERIAPVLVWQSYDGRSGAGLGVVFGF